MIYFGCMGDVGHHYHRPNGRIMSYSEGPFGTKIDGLFAPLTGGKQVQGVAQLVYENGWTVLAFWDRSFDIRPDSNSAFLAKGEHTFEQMVKMAKKEFPTVWKRFKFEVRLCATECS